MAEEKEGGKSDIEMVCGALFDFAIDRGDVKDIMARLPEIPDASRATLEHELQILKIISVGWSLSYHMPPGDLKEEITSGFWRAVQEFSNSLSRTTALLICQEIDFFGAVKGRFDTYLSGMRRNVNAPEPAVVIGPEFARICGADGDAHTVMAGARMFVGTVSEVKRRLAAGGPGAPRLP